MRLSLRSILLPAAYLGGVSVITPGCTPADDATQARQRGPLPAEPTTPASATDSATDSGASADTTTDTGFTRTGPTGTDTGASGTTADTADSATTGTLPPIDCAALSPSPLSAATVPGGRGYHGLVFADDGRLVGSDGNLVGVDSKGAVSVIVPGTGSLQQLDKLSDGTLVAASSSDGVVFTVDATTGGTEVISAGLSFGLYGLRVGPDDLVYIADQDRVLRIDPETGITEVWLDHADVEPKVLDFNIDYTKMYIGTNYSSGKVFEVLIDANYDPIGPPTVLAETPGSWHDSLTVDVCGNLYVAEYNNRAMYRITPDGQVGTLIDLSGSSNDQYGHGAVFGTGQDGWLADAIYVPQPYNGDTVAEIVVGVPHRTYQGVVLNGP